MGYDVRPGTPNTRDAVIFVPGLFHEPEKAINSIGRRVAAAMERQAKTTKAQFVVEEGTELPYDGRKAAVVTIVKKDGSHTSPILDLYQMDYGDSLTGDYGKKKPIMQALRILMLVVTNIVSLFAAYKRPSKNKQHKMQIRIASAILFVLALYMLVLVFTAFATAYDITENKVVAGQETGSPSPATQDGSEPRQPDSGGAPPTPGLLEFLQRAMIVIAALGLFTTVNVKQLLSTASAWITGASGYLHEGSGKAALTGQLTSLLDHIGEKESDDADGNGIRYGRKHIMGFSFGSLVAIDALFPYDRPSKRYSDIDALVTIGCPFDFIRVFWPDYFDDRSALGETIPKRWINVYAPADVLASDFRDETKSGPKERGVRLKSTAKNSLKKGLEALPTENLTYGRPDGLQEYSLLAKFGLVGFKVHSHYWGAKQTYATSCFDSVVSEMFKKEEGYDGHALS